MERYACAYRDAKSPLTPLTPLAQNPMYQFNLGGDNSLDECLRKHLSPLTKNEKLQQQLEKKSSPQPQMHQQLQQKSKLSKPIKAKTVTKTTKTTTVVDEKTTVIEKTITTTQIKRYSDYFNKLRNVFEKDAHHTNLLYATTAITTTLGNLISSAKKTTNKITSSTSTSKTTTASNVSKETPTSQSSYQKCVYEIDTPTPVRTPRTPYHTPFNTPKAPHPTPISINNSAAEGAGGGGDVGGGVYNTTPHMPKTTKSMGVLSNAYRGLKHLRVPECHIFNKSPKNNDKTPRPTPTPTKQKELQRENYKKYIRQISPIATKSLSPRIFDILRDTELTKYMPLFQREEIDFEVLRLMSTQELQQLGITNVEEQRRLKDAVQKLHDDFVVATKAAFELN